MDFCALPRFRAELVEFTGKSRAYTMSSIIAPMVEAGRIKLTLPDRPKSVKQRYVRA